MTCLNPVMSPAEMRALQVHFSGLRIETFMSTELPILGTSIPMYRFHNFPSALVK